MRNPIRNIPGHFADAHGRIWSNRKSGKARTLKKRTLIPNYRTGYLQFRAADHTGTYRNWHVHQLVAEAFHGPCPPGFECSHENGNRTDNRPHNLRWRTRRENNALKAVHGTIPKGEALPNSKLTNASVRTIRALWNSGPFNVRPRQREIAEQFGVSPSTIGDVVTGKGWKHVK